MEQCWPIKNLASRERDGWVRKRERETERVWVRDRKAKRGHESEIDERGRLTRVRNFCWGGTSSLYDVTSYNTLETI